MDEKTGFDQPLKLPAAARESSHLVRLLEEASPPPASRAGNETTLPQNNRTTERVLASPQSIEKPAPKATEKSHSPAQIPADEGCNLLRRRLEQNAKELPLPPHRIPKVESTPHSHPKISTENLPKDTLHSKNRTSKEPKDEPAPHKHLFIPPLDLEQRDAEFHRRLRRK